MFPANPSLVTPGFSAASQGPAAHSTDTMQGISEQTLDEIDVMMNSVEDFVPAAHHQGFAAQPLLQSDLPALPGSSATAGPISASATSATVYGTTTGMMPMPAASAPAVMSLPSNAPTTVTSSHHPRPTSPGVPSRVVRARLDGGGALDANTIVAPLVPVSFLLPHEEEQVDAAIRAGAPVEDHTRLSVYNAALAYRSHPSREGAEQYRHAANQLIINLFASWGS